MRNSPVQSEALRTLRRQAEKKLLRKNLIPDPVHQETDTLRLWHELQVHQIELEMRNDELKELYRTLEEETSRRIAAIEKLRNQEKLMIQQNRLAAMGEMINNIAHQWRQPLNVLGLKIQQLSLLYHNGKLDGHLLDRNTQDAMGLINHMSRTIDDFRNFFKTDDRKVTFSIAEAIQESVAIVQDSFKFHQIEISAVIQDDFTLDGCRNEFSQAMLNILQNARDAFVECKSASGRVWVVASVQAGKKTVTISDNAGGIPAGLLGRIFEPYFSTKGAQGTGIGLHMSKMIIENHMGGSISALNTSDGAAFKIEF